METKIIRKIYKKIIKKGFKKPFKKIIKTFKRLEKEFSIMASGAGLAIRS